MSVSMLDMHHSNWQLNFEKEVGALKQPCSTPFNQALRSTMALIFLCFS